MNRSMRGYHRVVWSAALVVLGAVFACGGPALQSRAQAVDDLIATARNNGAQRCAPGELAMAEAHVDFAKQELSEGDSFRARDELRIAEDNARAAVSKSPKRLCAPEEPEEIAEAPPPPPPPPPEPGDRDGDGLTDDVDQCPGSPEDMDSFQDQDGCPDVDNDGDGIVDQSDRCANEPEDKDNFEDGDGCPEADNDADGLADDVDQCANEPEDKDGFQDEDGCPDCDNDGDGVPECPVVVDRCPDKAANTADGCPSYKLVVVTEKKIELKQKVYFATNKTVIRSVSFPLLNEVAKVLRDNPKIRVRIEGHTDGRGSEQFNQRLSDGRADSVRAYMIERGIAPDRMTAQGFGESKPIADNNTRSGRAENRRVEFVILDR